MSVTARRPHPDTRAAIDRTVLTDAEPNTATTPAHLLAEVA
ncbi:hypothetical protein [Iamia sp. SCSIO 61187]|nr:hypothetical protein [Iamia sp. SCSIO 61187]